MIKTGTLIVETRDEMNRENGLNTDDMKNRAAQDLQGGAFFACRDVYEEGAALLEELED